jgi:VWFA-related protein
MRAGAASAAAALLFAGALHAQSLRESIDVHVLELEVAVLDRDGKPVRGLTRADFEVEHAKKRAEVTNFFAVERGAIVDVGGGAAAETAAVQTSIPTSLFILIDDTRLGQRAKFRTIDAVKGYVRQHVGMNTSAVLAHYNGSLDVRTRPTDRPGPLLAELDAIARSPAMLRDRERQMLIQSLDESLNGAYREFDMEARFRQLWRDFNQYAERQRREIEPAIDALREAVRLASAFEGRKVVLYASEGLSLMPGIEVFDYWDRATTAVGSGAIAEMQAIARDMYIPMEYARYDCSRLFRRVVQEAQKSNVLFFALDAGGVRASDLQGPEYGTSIAQLSSILVRSNEQDGVRMVANETGGRFIANENDLGRALAVMSEQFTTYYSLGIRAPASTRLSRITVRVKDKPHLRVVTARHRRPLTREEELQREVRSGLYTERETNPLGADVFVPTAMEIDGRCVVPLRIDVPREKLLRTGDARGVTLHFALLDARQQESDVRTTVVEVDGDGPIRHPLSLGLQPGRYVLSMVIVDRASGEKSSLRRTIDACVQPAR